MASFDQNMRNISEITKSQYLTVFRNALNVEADPLLEKIKKTPLRANEIKFGMRVGIGGGFGMSEEGADTPQARAPIYSSMTAASKDAYVDVTVSDKTVRLGQSDVSAMINAVADNLEASKEAAKWNVGRMLYGDGTGKLAGVTAVSGKVVTVDDVSCLKEGLAVDLWADGAASAADCANQIISIDHANKKVTLRSEMTGDAGALYVQNSKGREITGLRSIFDGTVTELYGKKKAEHPVLVPAQYDASNDIDDILISDAVAWASDYRSANTDMLLCGADAFRAYERYMRESQTTIVEKKMYVGGAVGYKIVCGQREVEVVRSRFVPSDRMWGVDTSMLELAHTDWDFLQYGDGTIFNLLPGKSVYRALLANYMELICRNPGGFFEIINASDPA